MEHILDLNEDKKRFKPIKYIVTDRGCWNCTSHHCNGKGKPMVARNGTKLSIARYTYITIKGKLPNGYVVRHTCDNPLCINPHHLIPGTQKDNTHDAIKRGRFKFNGNYKLVEEQVISILKDSREIKIIAKEYGVKYGTIYKIKKRITWADIKL